MSGLSQDPLWVEPSWTAWWSVGDRCREPYHRPGYSGVVVDVTADEIAVRYVGHPVWGTYTTRYGNDCRLERVA